MIKRLRNHCLLVLAAVFCLNLAADESRRWTDAKGKSLTGRLVIQDDTHVKIRSDKSGKIYNVAIDSLCRADRDYLDNQLKTAVVAPVAETSSEPDGNVSGVAKILALGAAVIVAIIVGAIIIGVIIQSIFLHMATRVLSFEGTFFTAIIGTVLVTIMQVVGQAIGYVIFSSETLVSAGLGIIISAVFGGFGVKIAYGESLGKCILAYIMSLVLYIVCIVVILIVAALCIGGIVAA